MIKRNDVFLGILGGMGPMAGLELHKRIIEKSPAISDQDHIKTLLYTASHLPDRTTTFNAGDDCSDEMINALKTMGGLGVNVGTLACNTAHIFFDKIQANVPFPLISLVDETCNYLRRYDDIHTVSILATEGTVKSKIYHHKLSNVGVEVVDLALEDQDKVSSVIYGPRGLKAGFVNASNRKKIHLMAAKLLSNGIDAVILGCTELSLLRLHMHKILDPVEIVAGKMVNMAYEDRGAVHG